MFPKIIHQIWLGKKPLPEKAALWRSSYAKFLPGWEYRLWTDNDLESLASGLACPHLVLDESVGMGIRGDVLRYEIARLHGGIYMDHDMELYRPLEEILIEDCVHFALSFNELSAVSSAFFGSPQGHGYWDVLLQEIDATVPPKRPDNPWDVLKLTGYQTLARTMDRWLGGNMTTRELETDQGLLAGWLFEHGDLVLWSREAVHPYHVSELTWEKFRHEDFPFSYAAHHWQGEWFSEDAEFKARAKTTELAAG